MRGTDHATRLMERFRLDRKLLQGRLKTNRPEFRAAFINTAGTGNIFLTGPR